MGANLTQFWGSTFRLPTTDRLALFAAGAGAGLAVAFNAPMAGAVFVLEELVRQFDIRIAIAALDASCSAIAVASLLLGQEPDFHVAELPNPSSWTGPIFALLGFLAGLAGVASNRLIIKSSGLLDGLTRWRPEVRALFIGALGACRGLGFGLLCPQVLADSGATPITFATAIMAAFLTATVRAPVTGMILIFEMTGAFKQAESIIWACFAAMAVPTLMGNSPIYDSMKTRISGVAKIMWWPIVQINDTRCHGIDVRA